MRPSSIDLLKHTQEELASILCHSTSISYGEFIQNSLLPKACVRSFEIIDETCKNIPDALRYEYFEFDWKGFAGMRDKLTHYYWGIDYQLLWDAIQHEVPVNEKWIGVSIEQELAKLSNK